MLFPDLHTQESCFRSLLVVISVCVCIALRVGRESGRWGACGLIVEPLCGSLG